MVLAYRILNMEGDYRKGQNGPACPYCGSKLNAALEYQLKDENSAECTPHHVPIEDGALLYRPFKETYDERSAELPARLCLCCGTEFGSIIMRNEKDENK